jgi:hypothetical protein
MRSKLIVHIKMVAAITLAASLLPCTAAAWTTTKLAEVSVSLLVAPRGSSQVTTQARFEVLGGAFHGFTVAPLAGAELAATECTAVTDDGRVLPLTYQPLDDGRMRVLFADDSALKYGAVTYTLVHRIDLVASGALRAYGGRARLDWTPLVWDEGTDAMTVDVLLPGESAAARPAVDPSVTQDYEVAASAAGVRLTKFRTVRWYPMQVIVDFDARLVPAVHGESSDEHTPVVAATSSGAGSPPAVSRRSPPPLWILLAPAIAAALGLAVMARKAIRLRRALGDLGFEARFSALKNTGLPLRFGLSAAAAALGVGAQYAGSLAAGVPALVAAVLLWVVGRETGSTATRPGGAWREMGDEDVIRYARLCRGYSSRRASIFDVTSPVGALAFLAALAAVGAVFWAARESWPRAALATLLDAAIWMVPAWFTGARSELPVDPTLESFISIRRWRRALDRLVGTRLPGAVATFFVREDEKGPIEVRLRVSRELPVGLRGIEVANELVAAGSQIRRRNAVVLHLEPGTELARRLGQCAHVAEHHLTPDLTEEVLVLRSRRGRKSEGLAPLRAALARIAG